MPYTIALDHYFANSYGNCNSSSYAGNWNNIGPIYDRFQQSTDVSGRVISLWVHPGNTNTILAGSVAGGLWKTTNGGEDWYNITDNSSSVFPGTIGITNIAVSPDNHDRIYVSAGSQQAFTGWWGSKYTLGLFYSTNGGTTWQRDNSFNNIIGLISGVAANQWLPKVAYQPGTDKLFAIFGDKIMYKPAYNQLWQNITPQTISGFDISLLMADKYTFSDFEFTSDNNTIVFSTVSSDSGNYTQYLFWCDLTTSTWNFKAVTAANHTGGWGFPYWGIQDISISSDDEVFMRFYMLNTTNNTAIHPFYKTVLAPGGATLLHADLGSITGGTPPSPAVIAVSPSNSNTIYLTHNGGSPPFSVYIQRRWV